MSTAPITSHLAAGWEGGCKHPKGLPEGLHNPPSLGQGDGAKPGPLGEARLPGARPSHRAQPPLPLAASSTVTFAELQIPRPDARKKGTLGGGEGIVVF